MTCQVFIERAGNAVLLVFVVLILAVMLAARDNRRK